MTLADLSGGGFSVRSETEFAVGVVLRFRFSTPDDRWSTLLSGQTVYIRPDRDEFSGTDAGFVVGFKFMNPELPRVAASIHALINRASAVISIS